jgi:hypothetical protein
MEIINPKGGNSGKLFFFVLAVVLIGMMTLYGCSSLSDSSAIINTPSISEINIPSTSYPIDIACTVIVARNEIVGGYVSSYGSQRLYWIFILSIRNKTQEPFAGGGGSNVWQVLSKANTPLPIGLMYPQGYTNSVIQQGQTGTLILEYSAPINVDPNNYQIEYDVVGQVSIGNLTYNEQIVNYYDWDTKSILASYTSPTNTQSVPTVTKTSITTWTHTGYVSSTMQGYGGGYSSITFQDGFSLTFVGTIGNYSQPSIGGKFEVKYYYDTQRGGNVITSLTPVQ